MTIYSAVTADQDTGYVLCADVNYDPAIDPGKLEADALLSLDYTRPPPYRAEARLWLPGEYYAREVGNPAPVVGCRRHLPGHLRAQRYALTAAREDVE